MKQILAAFAGGKLTHRQAVFFLALTAFLWSTSGLFIKLLPLHPIVISALRSLGTLLVLLLFRRGHRIVWNRANVVTGVTVCLTILFFVAANKLTTSANAIVLQYTCPVFTLLYSFLLFKTKARKKDLAVVFCTFSGMALFFFENLSPGNLLGNILAIMSGMTFAWMHIHCAMAKSDAFDGIIIGQIFTVLAGLPFLFYFAPPEITVQSGLILLYLGVVQMGLPYVFFGIAMRSATPLDGALITMVEPLFNPVWVFLALGETPGAMALFGGAIVIFSIGAWCVSDAKEKAKIAAGQTGG